MVFSVRKITPPPPQKKKKKKNDIKIGNQSVMASDHGKFLEVYIDKKPGKILISFIAGTIAREIGIVIKARKYFTHECMMTERSLTDSNTKQT